MTDDNGQKSVNHGDETVMTYRAFQLVNQKNFELLFQCDESGKQVFGTDGQANPNLSAQDRQQLRQSVANPVGKPGPSEAEQALQEEVKRLREMLAKKTPDVEITSKQIEDAHKVEKPAGAKRGPKPSKKPQEQEA